MKKPFLTLSCFILGSLVALTQTEEKSKEGWNLGALPSVMYDTDVGFQYGAILNLYQYGDGSFYPRYRYMMCAEWSRQTKGGAINQLLFDAPHLLSNGTRITVDFTYLTEQTLDFYGFNGREASYLPSLEDPGDEAYISRMFYRHRRELWRLQADMQGRLNDTFRWVGGVGYFKASLGSVDLERLNKGKDPAHLLPDTASLFDKYLAWGILPDEYARGGIHFLLKGGLVYDTRDNEPNPTRGTWSEALLVASPTIKGTSQASFIRYALIHRQYFRLKEDILSLAYRVGLQGTLVGETPYYLYSFILCSFDKATNRDGLGGARTLRGILRNRIVGDGVGYANLELRWKFLRTTRWNQNLYLALNAFTDGGMVTLPFHFDESLVPPGERWATKPDRPHLASGAGLRIAMNQNFIIAMDYGMAWKAEDGRSGLYINLGYLF